MSHITYPKCGSNEHYCGYGLAAGGVGSYTICLGCDALLDSSPDPDFSDDEQDYGPAGREESAKEHFKK